MKYLVTGTTSGIGKCIKQKLQGHELFEINRADIDLNRPELLLSVDLPVVDYAILNAGHDLGGGVPFADHESVSIQKILNCNLVSNVLITQKLLKNNPNTVIVLITSTNINRQYPNNVIMMLICQRQKRNGRTLKGRAVLQSD